MQDFAANGRQDIKLTVANAAFSLADLALARGAQTPYKLAQLSFTDGAVDLAEGAPASAGSTACSASAAKS